MKERNGDLRSELEFQLSLLRCSVAGSPPAEAAQLEELLEFFERMTPSKVA
jgi:hypothetical protein